jgi:ABC-2 type transport system ATP-binding protein
MVALGTPSELKRNSMKGELLLVECGSVGPALELLQGTPQVLDVAVFGNALHLVVQDATSAEPRLKQTLKEQGISVSRIEKINPTLEDVFVSLTAQRSEGEEHKA